MKYKVNTLQLAGWALPGHDDTIPLTMFRMDRASYSTLVDWTRAKTGRDDPRATAVIRGLHEVASLFVPDVVYVTIARTGGLEMTFLGDVPDDRDRRSRLRTALATWLGTVYAEGTTPQQRASVADAAMRDGNWTVEEVGTGLRGRGANACDEPSDRRLWDALTARVVRALAGRSVSFESGLTKRLIPTVPTSGPFEGVELVAFPPDLSSRRGGGYYSEVIRICTANLPERDGIYILAHTSIRNWGEVRSPTRGNAHRSLDVFIPQVPDLEYLGPQRHGAFSMNVVLEGERGTTRRPCVGRWQYREEEDIFGIISRLTGFDGLPVKRGLAPLSSPDGVWVLPRLGSFHGDRYLPGGTGRSMRDQQALVEAVGRAVEPLGLDRLPPVHRRVTSNAKPEVPFTDETPEDLSARRAAVACAIRAVNGTPVDSKPTLDLLLFARRDTAATDLRSAVTEILGQPSENGDVMRWDDGLSVRLHVHAAGPLAEALASWEEPTDEDLREYKTTSEWNAERRRRQDETNQAARKKMEEWVRSARSGVTGSCCAILEIPEEFRGVYHDPFLMAKQVLAGERVLPQVVLVKAEASNTGANADEEAEDDNTLHRFGRAFADLLRALGVVPTSDEHGQGLAALTVAQVNSARQSGMKIESQAVPLAAQVRDGVLWAALPGNDGMPAWRPYAEVYLSITSAAHGRFDRAKNSDNKARFAAFWHQSLKDISRKGGGMVLVDAPTGRQWLEGISNKALVFDRLEIGAGNQPLLPQDLPGVRIVRVTEGDAKLPSYYHEEDAGWVHGIFAWPESERMVFSFKQKPTTNKKPKAPLITSRHAGADAGRSNEYDDRKLASIGETCATFIQPGDDPLALVWRVHHLRGVHAQYGGDTSLPYPLHELALLKNAVTG
jgi:hypothetical protein